MAFAILVLAVLWAGLILVAPRVVALGDSRPGLSGLGGLTFVVGGLVCHQRPERSFHVAGVQFPVCARCTGLYLAAPLGMLAVMGFGFGFGSRRAASGRASSDVYRRWRDVLLLAALPTVVSIILERLGGPSGTVSRALAALPLGAAAGAVVVGAALGHFGGRHGAGNGV